MKRVLIISPSNEGTIALCTLNLYEALKREKDTEVRCLLLYKVQNGYKGFDECESIVNRQNDLKKSISYFKKIKAIREYKREFHPDITISTLTIVNTLSMLSGGAEKKIGVFHSPFKQAKLLGWGNVVLQFLSYLLLYPGFDKLFCVSEEVKKSVLRFPTIPRSKVKVVYNIHDTSKICKMAVDKLEEDSSLFACPGLLYCGRLDKNKAPLRAIKAYEKSSFSKYGNLLLMGADTDNLAPVINKYIESRGLSTKVLYIGPKSNPYKYMNACCGLLSSSYSEGLPGVMIEALVLGKPVISTNSSEGVWEILEIHNEYSESLNEIAQSPVGCISSNLAEKNPEKECEDIENLANAIDCAMKLNTPIRSNFLELVEASNILNEYLL